jgi:hypothetical protein
LRAIGLFLLGVAGCASMAEGTLRDASARSLGCPTDGIVISDDVISASRRTWTATCGGKAYACETTAKYAADTTCQAK